MAPGVLAGCESGRGEWEVVGKHTNGVLWVEF